MGRLNDTARLRSAPANGREHSISVEKIENGYLVCTSSCNPRTGEYTYSKEFSRSEPELEPPRLRRASGTVGESGLADTVRYLGKNV